MKRILVLITVAALALAALLSALKLAGSDAAHAGSAPQGLPCASEITATDADGHGSVKQYEAPELVFINGKDFPALTGLTFTVTHQGTGTEVASGSFISGPDGDFTAQLVWDGANAFQGDEAYRIVVTPAAGGCPAADDIQYRDDQPGPSKRVTICHRTSAETNPYIRNFPAIANNGDLEGGHLNHTGPVYPEDNWGDIIPPYTYVDKDGQTQLFPGYNWTTEGQAIYENGCNQPSLPPTPNPEPITPLLDCVEVLAAGGFLAHFGYDNRLNSEDTVVLVGPQNEYSPLPLDRGQPIRFEGGIVVEDADIQAESEDGSDLAWSLTGNSATARISSKQCEGSITIIKEVEGPLNPDPGRFNLEIDRIPIGDPARDGDSRTAAVTVGPHTVGESGAGTDLSLFHTQIVCRTDAGDGDVVADATGTSVQVTVRRGEALVCTITNTRQEGPGPDPLPLTPVLECVVMNDGEPDIAVWGYQNPNDFVVTVPIGGENGFSGGSSQDLGQPDTFQEGRLIGVFQTPFDAGSATLVWALTGKKETASADSPRCTATVELRKVVVPSDDPGVFNLMINEDVGATGGNGTTTGPVVVGVGEGTVSETAGSLETNLTNYETTIDCTRNGVPVLSVEGTKVDGAVANGDEVVCTFTNRRSTTPPPEDTATIELRKVVVPSDDLGVFNLLIGGNLVASGGNGTTTGPVVVGVGTTTVSETAGNDATTLSDYQSTIDCTRNGQPVTSVPGTQVDVAAASGDAVVCTFTNRRPTTPPPEDTATIELRKVVVPGDDAGVFNLRIGGNVIVTGGNGTTTGPVVVGVGTTTVSETAGNAATTLSDYQSTIDCTRSGQPAVAVQGTTVDLAVTAGDVVVCTFTNRRSTTPGPEPPPEEQLDLVVTKTAEPTTVQEGEVITWTMTVTNESSVEAADVNGSRVDDRPYGIRLLSLTTSQGVCTIGAGCALGRLPPGASVTVTAVTRATQVGDAVNCVEVGSEEIESDYLNNTACALARVTGNPPPVADRCGSLVAAPGLLRAARESVVLATARNLVGRPLAGVLVRARGAGIEASARTNARGVARFTFTAPRLGIIRFKGVGPRTRAVTRLGCQTRVGVLRPKKPPPLTGRFG